MPWPPPGTGAALATTSVAFPSGIGVVAAAGTGVAVGLLKNRPSIFGLGVAVAPGAGATGVTAGVIAGSATAVAFFLCERLFAAGDSAAAGAPDAAGEASAVIASPLLPERCRDGVGDSAGDGFAVAEPATGVGEGCALRVRCFAGEGEAAGDSLGVGA